MGSHIVVGIDVGTSKVSGVAAEVSRKGVRVLGTGTAQSSGLKKGIIVNTDAAADRIRKALKETEASAGIKINSASVTISGSHVRGFEITGGVSVRGSEVSGSDVTRAVTSAKAVYIPLDREVLHAISTGFVIDGDTIVNAVGVPGRRLEARVHLITGAASAVRDLLKSCSKAGVHVADVICEPLASAHSTLTRAEKQSGTILADIGGGTAGVAYFKNGALRHAGVVGIGGNHLTNDIAVGLNTSISEAERIKKEWGAALPCVVTQKEEIAFLQPDGQERTIRRNLICEILQPRCEELLDLISKETEGTSRETFAGGIVLTGGASLLKGFRKMAETRFRVPVRIGLPGNIRGLDAELKGPESAAAVGLVTLKAESTLSAPDSEFQNLTGKAKDWLKNFFGNKNLNPITRKEGECYV